MSRERGYYWVRTEPHRPPEVALWDGDSWYLCGYDLDAEAGEVLSERLLPPDWDRGPHITSEL